MLFRSLEDPREHQQGPLPKPWAHYSGLHVDGDQVVLRYTVGTTEVIETPGFESVDGQPIFTRTIQFVSGGGPLTLLLADGLGSPASGELKPGIPVPVSLKNGLKLALASLDATTARVDVDNEGRLLVKFAKVKAGEQLRLALSNDPRPEGFAALAKRPATDIATLTKGGPARWTAEITTECKLGTEDGPYQVDTITEPFPNVYNTRTFWGGFDFLPDGRAAICAFHGDVWIVSGLDDKLGKLTWKRFATGLFQPLGLKVVGGKIYVTGRDQITRLHDLNNDGEADFYESFNNDTVVTANYHEFCLDLQTDQAGNFYYAKGSPWTPDVRTPHQGTMLKVSKDGSKLEVFATGLRAPNGAGMGPNDELTVSDNQGHWMPASKLNLVKKGGFYGMMPAAQRELELRKGDKTYKLNPSDPQLRKEQSVAPFDGSAPIPTSYDQPICWLPMNMDNSSGGQVWATTDKWGPLKNHMLFMSYGRGTLFHVMTEEVDGVTDRKSVV